MNDVAVVVVDTETSGLNPRQHMILEIGIDLYTRDLEQVASWSSLIVDENSISHLDSIRRLADEEASASGVYSGLEPWRGARIVYDMHQKNGLDAEIRAAYTRGTRITLGDAECAAQKFMKSAGIGRGKDLTLLPMTGSSLRMDRDMIEEYMPILGRQFHYRSIDVSAIKEAVKLWRDDLQQKREKERGDTLIAHRVLGDTAATIEELRFYRKHLFAIKGM